MCVYIYMYICIYREREMCIGPTAAPRACRASSGCQPKQQEIDKENKIQRI